MNAGAELKLTEHLGELCDAVQGLTEVCEKLAGDVFTLDARLAKLERRDADPPRKPTNPPRYK